MAFRQLWLTQSSSGTSCPLTTTPIGRSEWRRSTHAKGFGTWRMLQQLLKWIRQKASKHGPYSAWHWKKTRWSTYKIVWRHAMQGRNSKPFMPSRVPPVELVYTRRCWHCFLMMGTMQSICEWQGENPHKASCSWCRDRWHALQIGAPAQFGYGAGELSVVLETNIDNIIIEELHARIFCWEKRENSVCDGDAKALRLHDGGLKRGIICFYYKKKAHKIADSREGKYAEKKKEKHRKEGHSDHPRALTLYEMRSRKSTGVVDSGASYHIC